jgi:ribosomal protein S18 acetylase RimI-like enzyme
VLKLSRKLFLYRVNLYLFLMEGIDMQIVVRAYQEQDLPRMVAIWNEVVDEGIAFPQEEDLDAGSGRAFFAAQTYTAVAEDQASGTVLGLYILHPNNIGRCGHIANASYAVGSQARGLHVGEKLVLDCLKQGRPHGFKVLQFNAVVASNVHARHLYERLGFKQLGVIPGGFRMKDGHYEDICPYYHEL